MFNIYGFPFLITYVCCMFFMTFGLFNLITAILVESTIEAAKSEKFRGVEYYREEQLVIAQKMKKIVQRTSDLSRTDAPVTEMGWQWRFPDISFFNLFGKSENLNQ